MARIQCKEKGCEYKPSEHDTLEGYCMMCAGNKIRQVKQLQTENARLRKALKKYGRHISCARRHTIVHRKGKWEDGGTEKRWVAAKCDCGLEQALKESKDG